MKSRAEIARERIGGMVGTLPDGTKYATCPEGLSILHPPKDKQQALNTEKTHGEPVMRPVREVLAQKALADIRKLVEDVLANDGNTRHRRSVQSRQSRRYWTGQMGRGSDGIESDGFRSGIDVLATPEGIEGDVRRTRTS